MKLFTFIALIFALIATIAGFDAVCNEEYARNGNGKIACMAYMPSFSYNPATKDCDQFIYGGCGGNGNRFPTLDECKKKCME